MGAGRLWKPVSQWSPDNTWKWDTNSEDAGKYQISVWVRDEMHAGPQFTPDEKIVDFLLTAPQAPILRKSRRSQLSSLYPL